MQRSVLIIDPSADFYRSELAPRFPTVHFSAVKERSAVTQRQLAPAEAIFGLGESYVFDEALLEGAPQLRWIQALTTGSDNILSLNALRPEVIVTTNTGIQGPQMSEMAFLHMLSLARKAWKLWDNKREHRWERWQQIRLAGKTVVIVGVGSVAESLALRCKAFDMRVLGVSSTPRDIPGFDAIYPRPNLEKLAAQADFLVVLAPLTVENVKFVSARVINAMKPSAYLVNISRGAVIDEEALLAALREKRLAGAGLDVFTQTPLPPEHPFWGVENVIISSHMAGGSDVNHILNASIIERNLRCFVEGNTRGMINIVDREVSAATPP